MFFMHAWVERRLMSIWWLHLLTILNSFMIRLSKVNITTGIEPRHIEKPKNTSCSFVNCVDLLWQKIKMCHIGKSIRISTLSIIMSTYFNLLLFSPEGAHYNWMQNVKIFLLDFSTTICFYFLLKKLISIEKQTSRFSF